MKIKKKESRYDWIIEKHSNVKDIDRLVAYLDHMFGSRDRAMDKRTYGERRSLAEASSGYVLPPSNFIMEENGTDVIKPNPEFEGVSNVLVDFLMTVESRKMAAYIALDANFFETLGVIQAPYDKADPDMKLKAAELKKKAAEALMSLLEKMEKLEEMMMGDDDAISRSLNIGVKNERIRRSATGHAVTE